MLPLGTFSPGVFCTGALLAGGTFGQGDFSPGVLLSGGFFARGTFVRGAYARSPQVQCVYAITHRLGILCLAS